MIKRNTRSNQTNLCMAQNEESVLGITNISVSTVSYQKGAC